MEKKSTIKFEIIDAKNVKKMHDAENRKDFDDLVMADLTLQVKFENKPFHIADFDTLVNDIISYCRDDESVIDLVIHKEAAEALTADNQ